MPGAASMTRVDERLVEQVPGGIVGIGDEDRRGLMLPRSRPARARRRAESPRASPRRRSAPRRASRSCRNITNEGSTPARPRPGARRRARAPGSARRSRCRAGSPCPAGTSKASRSRAFSLGRRRVGVAVDRRPLDDPGDARAERLGQRVRVLHRVELHHARAVRDVVGLQREDLARG